MDKKQWKEFKEKLNKLPLDERLAYLKLLLKKVANKEIKKEIKEEIKKIKIQIKILREQKKPVSISLPSHTPIFIAPRRDEKREVLTEKLIDIVPEGPKLPTQEISKLYTPSTSGESNTKYMAAKTYAPTTEYSAAENPEGPAGSLSKIEREASLHQREREEKERFAAESDKSMLETTDFLEYKPAKKKKNNQ